MTCEKIIIHPYDEVYVKIETSQSVSNELYERFKFLIPNAKYHKKVKIGVWSGEIHLYNKRNRTIYKGLIDKIKEFCDARGYEFVNTLKEEMKPITADDLVSFLNEIKAQRDIRDYQLEYAVEFINKRRALLLSPTSSGKSFILYALIRWFNVKTLLIVPSISLVNQMKSDFIEYTGDDWNPDVRISTITGGKPKSGLSDVVVSTWQSVYQQPQDWFDEYELVIVDECHTAKASSLIKIMENLKHCALRVGTTGTLDGLEINELTITGLFGPIFQAVKTADLIEQGYLSNIKINAFILSYNKESRKLKGKTYDSEVKFLISHERRNLFLSKLAKKVEGNVLLLYRHVDAHGKKLYDILKNIVDEDTEVFFIHGGVSGEKREEIRKYVDSGQKRCIIVASYGTTSVGVNIINLNNIIFASPSKSRIRVLQSIGRGLRKGGSKNKMTLFDIADDLSLSKKRKNMTLNHFVQRLQMYNLEQFPYEVRTVDIE